MTRGRWDNDIFMMSLGVAFAAVLVVFLYLELFR